MSEFIIEVKQHHDKRDNVMNRSFTVFEEGEGEHYPKLYFYKDTGPSPGTYALVDVDLIKQIMDAKGSNKESIDTGNFLFRSHQRLHALLAKLPEPTNE